LAVEVPDPPPDAEPAARPGVAAEPEGEVEPDVA
jgi:hypothetical protein